MKYAIDEQSMTDIADAVRYRTNTFEPMDVETMVAKMKKKYMVNCDVDIAPDNDVPWTRPADWPDLDSLNLEFTGDTDFVYMTYKCGMESTYVSLLFELYSTDGAQFSLGYIDNGTFIEYPSQTYPLTVLSGYTAVPLGSHTGYVVARIVGKIKKIFTRPYTVSNVTMIGYKQPMVERIAYIPNVTNITNASSSDYFWGTSWLEHDVVNNGNGANLKIMN